MTILSWLTHWDRISRIAPKNNTAYLQNNASKMRNKHWLFILFPTNSTRSRIYTSHIRRKTLGRKGWQTEKLTVITDYCYNHRINTTLDSTVIRRPIYLHRCFVYYRYCDVRIRNSINYGYHFIVENVTIFYFFYWYLHVLKLFGFCAVNSGIS